MSVYIAGNRGLNGRRCPAIVGISLSGANGKPIAGGGKGGREGEGIAGRRWSHSVIAELARFARSIGQLPTNGSLKGEFIRFAPDRHLLDESFAPAKIVTPRFSGEKLDIF